MARSAIEAGYEVVVYARWEPGSPLESEGDGYRIIRVPALAMLAVPGMRSRALRRIARIRASAEQGRFYEPSPAPQVTLSIDRPVRALLDAISSPGPKRIIKSSLILLPAIRLAQVVGRRAIRQYRRISRSFHKRRRPIDRLRLRLILFPFRPIGWARAIELIAEPVDIWHGMWAGSLPALGALRRRFDGRTIYDSRDIYMRSRGFEQMAPTLRRLLAWLERRWARNCDAVITVNDAYARLLAKHFDIAPLPIVRNTPSRFTVPQPRPNKLRDLLGLPASERIVLYQGALMTERGIEQGMDAILQVPDAVLVVMGYGGLRDKTIALASTAPYSGKVRVIDPVPPAELLTWTASADVMLMAIQPTTLNHWHTTPNKLWEAIAAGVPIVASDLAGMSEVVREVGCGVLVDGTDPAAIAAGIRQILDGPPEERQAMSSRAREAAARKYNWEAQVDTLLGLYARLTPSETSVRGT
jgi:glycosyltransferase involved in cell wall biosynthesis